MAHPAERACSGPGSWCNPVFMQGLAFLLIAVANVLGGISYLWQDFALEGLPPGTVSAGRNAVAILCMLMWLACRGSLRVRYPRQDLARLAIIGVAAYGAPILLGIVGVRHSTPGNASILVLLEPAAIVVLSYLILNETIRRIQGIGIAIALGGAWIIVLEGASLGDLFGGDLLYGNLLLAAHGVLWGFYTPLMKPLAVRYRPLDLTFLAMLFSLVLLVPASLLESPKWTGGPRLGDALLWTVILGVLVSFGATLLWNQSLKYLPAFTVGVFVFLQPLTGVFADFVFRDRRPSGQVIGGGVLILVGVFLVILPYRRRRFSNPPCVGTTLTRAPGDSRDPSHWPSGSRGSWESQRSVGP